MHTDHLPGYIEDELNDFYTKRKDPATISRLHENFPRRLLKIWVADRIIKHIGLDSPWDDRIVDGFPYKKAREFLIRHDKNMSLLFGSATRDWKKIGLTEKEDKRLITESINNKLKSVCNVRLSNMYKGRRSKEEKYQLKGLEVFDKFNVKIPYNLQADQYHSLKTVKRLMCREKVQEKIWKCWTELVPISDGK